LREISLLQSPGTRRRLFDSILKRGLDARRNSEANGCPDEATLAAYCDRSLPPSQAGRWEEHFSDCARCQGTLAAMVRARSAGDSAITGPMVGRRWELYAALAAAVAGISIAVGLMRKSGNPPPPAGLYSSKGSNAPAQFRQKPAVVQKAGPQIALNENANQVKREPSSTNVAKAPPHLGENETLGGLKREARRYEPRYLKHKGEFSALARSASPQKQAQPQSEHESGAAAPPSRLSVAPPPQPPQEIAGREFAPSLAPGAAPEAPFAGSRAVGGSAPSAAPMAGHGPGLGMISVRTADNVERWRLGTNGTIQHREPDGSWQEQSSGVSSALRAGAAPSPTTCWIVGSAGTILRTSDGEHWQKIDSPTSNDLIDVFATDASDATVTADDGKRFATADAGRTWRPL
jgi:hypothetical protein